MINNLKGDIDMAVEELKSLLEPVMATVARHDAVDSGLEAALADAVPPGGPLFERIEAACREGVEDGWLCFEGEGNRKFGRAVEPSAETHELSVDVVDLTDIRGGHHVHPNGEILMIMPQTEGAKFDGRGKGWLVYGPGTGHRPTVRGGRALVLYLLPEGKIEWTGT
jgi:hypothetical protein